MINREIDKFVRIIGSLSLNQSSKERITEFLIRSTEEKKEASVIYVAVASAVACLAVGTILLTRGTKQDV
ncbi:MAG: hypothetical protein J6J45_04880 [Clostridia bacterium]|nr:hypothetical protein [Clostridia bacterium]